MSSFWFSFITAFFGSAIPGLVTYLLVWFTLRNSSKEDKK